MLEATRSLLASGGLGAVTIAAVARQANASNGSLYHRFGDRTGLLLATQQRCFEQISAETAEAFAGADAALAAEVSREMVAEGLAAAALAIFRRHHGAFRAFLVEGNGQPEFEGPSTVFLHDLARRVTSWLREHLDAGEAGAEAAWRLLFSIGAGRAIADDAQVSPTALADDVFARALAAAVLAVTDYDH